MIDQTDHVIELLKKGDSFLVITHENPDGDAIGALLALTRVLRSQGKQATPYDHHGVPPYLEWLPDAGNVIREADPAAYDVVCVLDCGDAKRMGPIAEQVLTHKQVVNIDHHGTNDGFGTANIVDPHASSTCEMLYGLFAKMDVSLTPEVATLLYLGVYTDTGMFKNANSTSASFHAAGEMVAAGAQFMEVAQHVYIDTSAPRLQLLARVLSTLQIDADGNIAGVVCTTGDLLELGLAPSDLENFVEYPRSIVGVKAAYLLRELDGENQVKGSMRANNDIDVAVIAQMFGGGGHRRAAGFRTDGSLKEIRAKVVAALRRAMEQA